MASVKRHATYDNKKTKAGPAHLGQSSLKYKLLQSQELTPRVFYDALLHAASMHDTMMHQLK